MKRIVILGSTGSIGRSTLEVIKSFPRDFSVVGLSAGSNVELLASQARRFKVPVLACADYNLVKALKIKVPSKTKVIAGIEGIQQLASLKNADIILVATSGFSALYPLLAAIKAGKQIALANKEALVSAGSIIKREIQRHKATLVPIDSEQCAIFQCLAKEDNLGILKSIILTASGGPLYFKRKDFRKVDKKDVLSHPRWSMGKKISVDSATLMNKGLEVIEAKWLFGVDVAKIKVLIHPQAAVHSMVEFIDGSILAQLSITDMRIPIQFALSYPERLKSPLPSLDFHKIKNLDFSQPDMKRFPCLSLAYQAARMKQSAGTVLNAANEEAVAAFLRSELNFASIPKVVEKALKSHKGTNSLRLEDIENIDFSTRKRSREFIKKIY
ncbi:MAG: 1-deoxy-D-xylulose-5-phosphate reductoisomerase [Candidatus Omnitrophica bacterium]|nr:1-deoxy-D-xylulose-5-phosphate reductoisomerase [Candidatus Omnitrophota bacterium]